jgi:hypothetical protein
MYVTLLSRLHKLFYQVKCKQVRAGFLGWKFISYSCINFSENPKLLNGVMCKVFPTQVITCYCNYVLAVCTSEEINVILATAVISCVLCMNSYNPFHSNAVK